MSARSQQKRWRIAAFAWWALWLTLAAARADEPANRVLELDGRGAYVELPAGMGDDADQLTVEFWVRWDRLGYFSAPLHFGGRTNALALNNRYGVELLQTFLQPGSAVPIIAGTGPLIELHRWMHLAATLGNDQLCLFVNGVCLATNEARITARQCLAAAPMRWLGRSPWEGNAYFRGALDDVRIWSRTLSAEELRRNALSPGIGTAPGLLAAWAFDDLETLNGDRIAWSTGPRRLPAILHRNARLVPEPTPRSPGLPPPASAELVIRGADIGPVAARVFLWNDDRLLYRFTADGKGRVSIRIPAQSKPLRLQAIHGNLGIWTNLDFAAAAGRPIELTLPAAPVLAGAVRARDGSPQPGVDVAILPVRDGQVLEERAQHVLTDVSGRFEAINPAPGSYRVKVMTGADSPAGTPTVAAEQRVEIQAGVSPPETIFQLGRIGLGNGWTKVTRLEGGFSGTVTALAADSDGALWIGNGHSLVRLDRSGTRVWDSASGLVVNEVTSVALGSSREVWVGTDAGLFGQSGERFVRWPGSPTGRCEQVTVATDGSVWCSEAHRVWRLRRGTWRAFDTGDGLPGGNMRFIDALPAQEMVVRSEGGRVRIDGDDALQFESETSAMPVELGPSLAPDPDHEWDLYWATGVANGERWAKVDDVIARSDGSRWIYLPDPLPPGPYSGRIVTKAVRAFDGRVWIGAGPFGLFAWNPRPPFVLTRADGLPDRAVNCSAPDASGGVWVGTRRGLAHWTGRNMEVFDEGRGLPSPVVTRLALDRSGILWIGTAGGLARYSPAGGLEAIAATRFLINDVRTRGGDVWVATAGDGVLKWDGAQFRDVAAAAGQYRPFGGLALPMGNGDGWFTAQGFYRVESSQLKRILVPTSEAQDDFSAIDAGPDGAVWIGTFRNGLFRLREGRVERVPGAGETGSDWIHSLRLDREGRVWCGKADGVSIFDGELWSQIDTRDGLPGSEVRDIRFDSDGSAWLSTDGGLVRYEALRKPPEVRFTRLETDRAFTRFDPPPAVRTRVPVTLMARVPGHPLPTRLRWRVNGPGESGTWSSLAASEEYRWIPRRRGRFTVEVMAVDRDLNRSAPARVELVVGEPWSTDPRVLGPLTFAGLALLAGLGGLWRKNRLHERETRGLIEAARRREEAAEQQEAFARELIASQESERKRIAQELHDSLGQELLLIRNSALLGDPQASGAGARFQDIADRASQAIAEVRQIAYALRPQELDRLGLSRALRTLAEEVAELGGLELDFESDPLEGVLTPEAEISLYRVVQEALSNILRYAEAKRLRLHLRLTEGTLTTEIADDGRGFDVAEVARRTKPGLGLSGMEERMRLLAGKLHVQTTPGSGCSVRCVLPVDPSWKRELGRRDNHR